VKKRRYLIKGARGIKIYLVVFSLMKETSPSAAACKNGGGSSIATTCTEVKREEKLEQRIVDRVFEVERRDGSHSLLSLHKQQLVVMEEKFVRAGEKRGNVR
jgi:hypothetical protein